MVHEGLLYLCKICLSANNLSRLKFSSIVLMKLEKVSMLSKACLPLSTHLDLDTNGTTEESSSTLQFGEALPQTPPPPPPPPPQTPPPPQPKPRSPRRAPSPPRQRLPYFPRVAPRQRSRSRGQRGGLNRGQMFEDPAVMRIIEGRPSLKVTKMCVVREML